MKTKSIFTSASNCYIQGANGDLSLKKELKKLIVEDLQKKNFNVKIIQDSILIEKEKENE